MRGQFRAVVEWGCGAFFLVAIGFAVWWNPVTAALLIVSVVAGLAWLTLKYDREHWRVRYLLWRNPDVLVTTTQIVSVHETTLARQMAEVLVWDGRWDYDMGPWQPIVERFIDDHVLPVLGPRQQGLVGPVRGPLRDSVRGTIGGRAFNRCKAEGWLQ